MPDRINIEFAASELLREIFNRRDDWKWMSMIIHGAVGYHKNGYEWIVYYTIGGIQNENLCKIRISPPDDYKFMTVDIEEQNFDLTDPQIFGKIEQFIDKIDVLL